MSQVTISGAVSGLDTATIVNQLVSAEANKQTLLKNEQADLQKGATAYGSLISALGALATQARTVATTSAWSGAAATSTSTGVSATATGNATGSLTFDVTSVAAAHTLISADTVSSLNDAVASGPLTVTANDGTTTTLDVGSGSLSDVVAAINSSSSGLAAAAVQTAPGQYRLQVAAKQTGSTSQFSLDGLDGFAGMSVLTQGADATVHIGGTSEAAFDATSSTNTFTDLVPGLSFTVSKVESGVTVSSSLDGSAVADQVSKLVDAANGILSQISTATAYNVSTKSGGALVGDSTVRTLQQDILGIVSGGGAAGVSLTRDGTLTFDRNAFLTAFRKDPAKVASAFGAQLSFAPASGVTGSASLVKATDTARAGTYPIVVTVSSARAQWRLSPPGGIIAGQTVVVMRGSSIVSYTAGATDTLADAVAAINARVGAVGLGIGAVLTGGDIVLTASSPGAAADFTVTASSAPVVQITAGRDVAGTIDGQAATGTGNALSLAKGTGGAVGLTVQTSVSDDDIAASGGAVGSVSYTPGLAQRLLTLVSDATSSSGGMLVAAQQGAQNEIKDFQDQIDAWDQRLADYRDSLTRQFTAMETALATMKSQTAFLSGLSTSMFGSPSNNGSG